MALEALSTTELLNFIIYDSLSATPFSDGYNNTNNNNNDYSLETNLLLDNGGGGGGGSAVFESSCLVPPTRRCHSIEPPEIFQKKPSLAVQGGGGRKKRRRKPKVCKNKEEAETQRMTHIAVERNRRKLMNEHLAVLRALMPESYVQRGDQASIVGGAIEYVKQLEHMLQSLEAKKFTLLQQGGGASSNDNNDTSTTNNGGGDVMKFMAAPTTPFAQFFTYPQFTCSQFPNKYTSKSKAAIADIEVTLIESHANVRILSRRRVRQLSKMVAAFQTLYMSILHLNVTTLDPLVLYSISVKVEEGCQFNSADDIASAVHHILRIIEDEAILCSQSLT